MSPFPPTPPGPRPLVSVSTGDAHPVCGPSPPTHPRPRLPSGRWPSPRGFCASGRPELCADPLLAAGGAGVGGREHLPSPASSWGEGRRRGPAPHPLPQRRANGPSFTGGPRITWPDLREQRESVCGGGKRGQGVMGRGRAALSQRDAQGEASKEKQLPLSSQAPAPGPARGLPFTQRPLGSVAAGTGLARRHVHLPTSGLP